MESHVIPLCGGTTDDEVTIVMQRALMSSLHASGSPHPNGISLREVPVLAYFKDGGGLGPAVSDGVTV